MGKMINHKLKVFQNHNKQTQEIFNLKLLVLILEEGTGLEKKLWGLFYIFWTRTRKKSNEEICAEFHCSNKTYSFGFQETRIKTKYLSNSGTSVSLNTNIKSQPWKDSPLDSYEADKLNKYSISRMLRRMWPSRYVKKKK